MNKYRKRPIVIEAEQFDEYTYMNSRFLSSVISDRANLTEMFANMTASDGRYCISTLEGDMTASNGDYIIKGVRGEFYPCKPDVFEKTYELVE